MSIFFFQYLDESDDDANDENKKKHNKVPKKEQLFVLYVE